MFKVNVLCKDGSSYDFQLDQTITSYKVIKTEKKDYVTTLAFFNRLYDIEDKLVIYNHHKAIGNLEVASVSFTGEVDGTSYTLFDSSRMGLVWHEIEVVDGMSINAQNEDAYGNTIQLLFHFIEG